MTIRTLPELPAGAKYRCVFGGAEPIDAGVTPFGLTCPTPSISYRPKISEGQDHVYVPLSVRSSETNKDFVSRNFAYFDCGSHKKCSDCVKSNWACNWCIYQNECIHNATECHGGTIISGEKVSRLFSHFPSIIKLQMHYFILHYCHVIFTESSQVAITRKKFVSSISCTFRANFDSKRSFKVDCHRS